MTFCPFNHQTVSQMVPRAKGVIQLKTKKQKTLLPKFRPPLLASILSPISPALAELAASSPYFSFSQVHQLITIRSFFHKYITLQLTVSPISTIMAKENWWEWVSERQKMSDFDFFPFIYLFIFPRQTKFFTKNKSIIVF